MCILWMEGCMLRISNFKPYNSQLVTSAVIWSRHEPFLLQAMIFLVGTKNWHLWLVPIWKPVSHWLVVKSDWLTIKNETLTHAKKIGFVHLRCWFLVLISRITPSGNENEVKSLLPELKSSRLHASRSTHKQQQQINASLAMLCVWICLKLTKYYTFFNFHVRRSQWWNTKKVHSGIALIIITVQK